MGESCLIEISRRDLLSPKKLIKEVTRSPRKTSGWRMVFSFQMGLLIHRIHWTKSFQPNH